MYMYMRGGRGVTWLPVPSVNGRHTREGILVAMHTHRYHSYRV